MKSNKIVVLSVSKTFGRDQLRGSIAVIYSTGNASQSGSTGLRQLAVLSARRRLPVPKRGTNFGRPCGDEFRILAPAATAASDIAASNHLQSSSVGSPSEREGVNPQCFLCRDFQTTTSWFCCAYVVRGRPLSAGGRMLFTVPGPCPHPPG